MREVSPSQTGYSSLEEKLNIITHGFGCLMSIVGLVLLMVEGYARSSTLYSISMLIFGVSLIVLYAASTLYHSTRHHITRRYLQIFDHAAIFFLIAGTYTPFSLLVLPTPVGWWIFGIVWSLAVAGIIMKLFFTGKFDILSTLFYVGMGWMIIFAFQPLQDNLPAMGVTWLVAGGIAYTFGAVLYSIKSIPFNHAIWHCFVLAGSFCHFMAAYQYI